MKQFIIHQQHHFGWTKDIIKANSLDDAVKISVRKYHDFLEKEYKGAYVIEHSIGEEYPRYSVRWNSDTPKINYLGPPLFKGDSWFSDRIESGSLDDCESCGGTGINFYNPFRQCWSCGDKDIEGEGTGKDITKAS